MSQAGEVWDNSAKENFFSTLKMARVHRKVYRTRTQARADAFDFIEVFYNPIRRHSTLCYVSPVKFEEALRSGGCPRDRQQPTMHSASLGLKDRKRAEWGTS
jgi:transposase InsO family protein